MALATRDARFPVFIDRDLQLYERWGVVAVPSVALVGADGRVLRTLDGYAPGLRNSFLGEAAAAGTPGNGECGSLARVAPDGAQRAN